MNNNKPFPRFRALALALAVSAVTVNSQAAEAGNTIQIQAQPLASALNQLGQQTNLQLFFSPNWWPANRPRRCLATWRRCRRCNSCCKAAG